MQDFYSLMLYAIQSIFEWMAQIEYEGLNVLHVCFFGFFLKLIWDLILAPILGNRSSGSVSVSLSDTVRSSRRSNNKDD